MAYPIPETEDREREIKMSITLLLCWVDFGSQISKGNSEYLLSSAVWGLTFENGTDVLPYGYGSGSVELSQRQLHVKERHATEDGHQNVGDKESTCTEMHKGTCYCMQGFYMKVIHGDC